MEQQDEKKPQVEANKAVVKHHPIQLVALQTTELHITVSGNTAALDRIEGCTADLEASHSAYDEAEQTIRVRVRALIKKSKDVPLSIHVEVIGLFKVDESKFDKGNVERWAQVNAPYVLYPYVREHVFSLTSRVGVRGVIMPLLEIPTIRATP